MNTTFNINRLGLLLKRYFIENKQRQFSATGIIIFVFIVMHRFGSAEMFLYVYGFIFAAGMFKVFNYTPGGMHYLLIPATHAEKLTAQILISIVYCFVMVVTSYTIGVTLGTLLENLIFGTNLPIQFELFGNTSNHMSLIHQHNLWNVFSVFAIIQSLFLLGSLYFKGNAIGKTFLAIIGITLILGLIELFFLKITFGTYHLNGQMINISISDGVNLSHSVEIAGNIIKYSIIPFLWVVSYFRLTQKQV
jgi:hypothetical protein